MPCILCISLSDQMLEIFDQNGINLNISNIITKHFWLQPNAEDNKARAICSMCWNKIESFHRFYQTIEEAHAKLSDCLKIPIVESDLETNYQSFSEFFAPVVKEENHDDNKVEELLVTPETELNCSNERKESLKYDSESEVPLVKLSIHGRPVKDQIYKESKVNHSDSDNDNDNEEDVRESDSESESDYSEQKKKARVKVKESSTENVSGKKAIPCKEFDNFIKQNMQLVCSVCNKSLDNFFSLKEHFRKAHKKVGYVTCCSKQFTSRFSLVHHLLLHRNPDLFKCPKCGRVLANKKSFKNHMSSHVNQERVHKCTKCNKSFSSIPKLEKHLNTHNRSQSDQICEQCGKVCHSKQSLSAHQKREHMGFVKQRVQCPKCGAYLADSSTLHTHMKYQHPKTEVLNVCNICGKISSTGYGLKRHIQYMHTMERVHKCTICDDKAFKTAQVLREHMTTHTGEVLYTCPHCPKTFNSNANMHSHRKKMHRKEWEENRRHPHMGATTNATEENNQ